MSARPSWKRSTTRRPRCAGTWRARPASECVRFRRAREEPWAGHAPISRLLETSSDTSRSLMPTATTATCGYLRFSRATAYGRSKPRQRRVLRFWGHFRVGHVESEHLQLDREIDLPQLHRRRHGQDRGAKFKIATVPASTSRLQTSGRHSPGRRSRRWTADAADDFRELADVANRQTGDLLADLARVDVEQGGRSEILGSECLRAREGMAEVAMPTMTTCHSRSRPSSRRTWPSRKLTS